MKICVYFQPKEKDNIFEGARLRKSIKGALEENNIVYAKDIIDTYDLIHFISLDDELKINDAKEERIPIVFSALNCESDNRAKILTEKDGIYILSPKAIRTLNKADVVLVSDNDSKLLLEENGIMTKIEIVSPGVNLKRFQFNDKLEENIFYNYYQLEKDQKFVTIIGTYKDQELRKELISIAELCPDIHFFYFGNARIGKVMRMMKSIPNNLRFCPLTDNEIYCSMMKCASIYLSLDNSHHCPITLLDAAASKTQIVALEPTKLNKEMLKKLNAYIGDNPSAVAEIINKLIKGELENKADLAYEYAKENSLENVGKRLVEIYQSLIGGK